MTTDKILNYCLQNLEGTVLVESWGEKGIFFSAGKTGMEEPSKKQMRASMFPLFSESV